ncbi:MAG: hypothetical protein GWN99_11000 [Gemmatimonadetes bacterium]|uniref:SPOR domain-containing protein n=1 Tax=Candidatus Kutchimonas denitrificans TaxID=3056748 RepID=A0AAE4Z9H9_9BACT|nr:hypothetical protein [Gemmatimonadota bacterium]NIR74992.1 hypothetical protein [Candidatus Kutchimonas denitrificans]NIS01575.1 hypothetical protein [Gemmatimonadota bacterium]NIT67313.1 hypothetical protein [Gemmatimonadota bacterium]NIU52676.1 hypothetical protein [Gemmatimonadota bacterium]
MYTSKRTATAVLLALALASQGGCRGGERTQLAASPLAGTAWLGSAEGWGLLGLPEDGGPVTYRRAGTLESPTWAPPELERITGAWQGEKAIWVQLTESRIARYDYATRHLLTWEDVPATELAVALEGRRELIIAPDGKALWVVGASEPWRLRLGGSLVSLRDAGDGRAVAVVKGEAGTEIVTVGTEPDSVLARRAVESIRDLAITAWGTRLYYLTADETDSVVHALTLPGLQDAEDVRLPAPGYAIAFTPSGHRLYAATGDTIRVFDRLRNRELPSVALPAPAVDLRFAITGATLLARLVGVQDSLAVLQVGVDSLLGVVPGAWGPDLPAVIPGGRLIARLGPELVLYDARDLSELARAEVGVDRRWFAVQWQPPRPRQEPAHRRRAAIAERVVSSEEPGDEGAMAEEGEEGEEEGAPPGFYAVVSAARERTGVDNLVTWLRSVGYAGRVDRHVDPMGVTWYRAMVGPYDEREEAEEAARSLGARYGYKPWILTVDGPGEDESGGGDSGELEN